MSLPADIKGCRKDCILSLIWPRKDRQALRPRIIHLGQWFQTCIRYPELKRKPELQLHRTRRSLLDFAHRARAARLHHIRPRCGPAVYAALDPSYEMRSWWREAVAPELPTGHPA